MSELDFGFWFFGASSWFIGIALFFSAIIWLRNTNSITAELKKTAELRKDTSELRDSISYLRKDLTLLGNGTEKLKEELGMTRTSIDKFYKTLQSIYWWAGK
jgi:hypothetical protein